MGRILKCTPPNGESFSATYNYNTAGQLTQKSSPDAGTVQYLYDRTGNLRFIKDANHQSTEVNNISRYGYVMNSGNQVTETFPLVNKGKVYFKLNSSNMEIYSGTITLQLKDPSGIVLYTLTANSSNPSPSGSFVVPKGNYICTVQSNADADDNMAEYLIQCSKNLDFIYNKYDAFNRLVETGEYETNSLVDFNQTNANNINFPTSSVTLSKRFGYDKKSMDEDVGMQENLKGRLSYSRSYTSDLSTNVAFYSYDEMGRVVWSIQKDMGWYKKKLYYEYDLMGNVIKKGFTDFDWRSGSYYTSYTYDQAGRLSNILTSNNSSMVGAVPEAKYDYFATGKIKRLQLGNAQGVDYRYNERDWLTMINHQNLDGLDPDGKPQDPGSDGHGSGLPGDKFGMIIDYNKIGHIGSAQGVARQWNGNISWVMYQMSGVTYAGHDGTSPLVGYTYSYDKMNRLTKADFGYYYEDKDLKSWRGTNAYDETDYSYDDNGNIRFLTRYGKGGQVIDNLGYKYNSGKNQLNHIEDYVADALFQGDLDNQADNNYLYDANGNLTKDLKNGIGLIIYEVNNLPSRVYKTNGSQLFYGYDANGNRVRNLLVGGADVYYTNSPTGQTEVVTPAAYGSKFTYNISGNDNIGQVKVDGSTASKYYYLKDHLGNIRVTVNSTGAVDSYNDYYPFGGIMDGRSLSSESDGRYKFTSKERDTETGLDYFGARYYDSRVGRWLSVDPLAEKYPEWSPYIYTMNNPLKYIDPDGKQSWPLNPAYKGLHRESLNNWHAPRDGGKRLHGGVDMNYGLNSGDNDRGGPVLATHDGVVTKVVGPEEDENGGGARIEITSKNGTVVTRYMHLNSRPNYKLNDLVKEGDIIGEMGGSGFGKSNRYTSHLHYELFINGKRIDPMGGNPKEPIDPQKSLSGDEVIPKVEPIYFGGETPTIFVTPKEEKKQ